VPEKEVRPFRHGNLPGRTIWYRSSAPGTLTAPPDVQDNTLAEGHLYVHTNTLTGDRQTWIFRADRTWGVAVATHQHPLMEDRVLWLRTDGEPSWITRHTYRTYQSKHRLDEARNLA
jgi:hypothetical protein